MWIGLAPLHSVLPSPASGQPDAVFEDLSGQAAPLIAKWKEIRTGDLAALNNQIQQNVPAIYLSPRAN